MEETQLRERCAQLNSALLANRGWQLIEDMPAFIEEVIIEARQRFTTTSGKPPLDKVIEQATRNRSNHHWYAACQAADLLQQSPQTPAALQPSLQQIGAGSRRAARLVAQLLDFSRKSLRRPQRLALDSLSQETVETLAGSLPEKIALELEVASGDYQLEADQGQIRQLLSNLVHNAGQAMPAGGRITLALSPPPFPPAPRGAGGSGAMPPSQNQKRPRPAMGWGLF